MTKLGVSGGALLRNITDCHGCGTCAMGCSTNAKQAMHISYLPLAQRAGRRGSTRATRAEAVWCAGRARVRCRRFDARRATSTFAARLTVHAPVVVVAAGTIHTPVVLKRSGLAGRSRQLGRNLRIHPAVGVGGAYPERIDAWKGTLQPYFVDELFDSHDVMLETTAPVPALAAAALARHRARGDEHAPGHAAHRVDRPLRLGHVVAGRVRLLPGSREPIITYKLNDD